MLRDLVLAIDLGSSWCKAAYVDPDGSIVSEGRVFSRTIAESGEIDLERFWQAVADAVRSASAGMASKSVPQAIAVSCRGIFGICLDRDGRGFVPPYDVLSAKRSPDVAAAFRAPVWGDSGPYAYGYAVRLGGLIAGVRRTDVESWRRIDRTGALHNFIVYRLCNRWVTDPTTGPSAMAWPAGLLELSGLPLEAFPEILDFWHVAGHLTPGAADALGLPAGVPVVTGLHDGAAANVGIGAVQPGDACLTLGTNFAVRVVTGERPASSCFGYTVAPGRWAWVNSVSRAASQLDLVASALAGTSSDLDTTHRRLGAILGDVALGTPLPHLSLGDDAALLDAVTDARCRGWRDGEIYLAMLFSAAAGMRELVDTARRDGAPATRFVATGGSSRNPSLVRVLASTLRASIETGHPEAGMLGAGMVAAIGAGWYSDLAAAWHAMGPSTGVVLPDLDVSPGRTGEVCA